MSTSDDSSEAPKGRVNADPFRSRESGSAEGAESATWARNLASADAADADSRSDSRSDSHKLMKKITEHASSGDGLTAVDTVRSAAHMAKQKLHLHEIKATGPSKIFNPTNVRVHVKWKDEEGQDPLRTASHTLKEKTYLWTSRDNRKGRNSLALPVKSHTPPLSERAKAEFKQIGNTIWRMCTVFAYWDTSWWSGWTYSVGSILFVMDGSWAWREVAGIKQSESLTTYGGPVCFFIGALLYQIGATMAYLEAVNDGSFQGSAMQRFLDGHEKDSKQLVDSKIHAFFGHFDLYHQHKKHHDAEKEDADVDPEAGWKNKDRRRRAGSIYPVGTLQAPRRGGVDYGEVEEGTSTEYTTWRWFPTWHALRTHHIYEIGYIACTIQLFGATLYGITGVVVLPGILDSLANWQTEAAFWIPQIVASCCFLFAGILFTLEPQEKWYKPAWGSIGWWVGAWAVIGSVGFLWIGITGAASYDVEWGEYQADLGTIWGSGAYLASSLCQWYEAMNKRQYVELPDHPES